MLKKNIYIAIILITIIGCSPKIVNVNLRNFQDSTLVLHNPDKGWYHHHLDNSISYYGVKTDGEIDSFPNLHHLFIRLPWTYFEPKQGEYDWSLIDQNVEKWVKKGYKISLDFTCHETNLPFATPKWVYEMGVKGRFFTTDDCKDPVWEPDYDDPLFLKLLDNFLKKISERYNGKPWLNDICIGTIGQWGEGHSNGPNQPTAHQVMEHLKLYVKNFPGLQIVANDDMINAGKTAEERAMLHAFCVQHGISYRDDSVFWEGDMNDAKVPFSIRNYDLFDEAWKYAPTTLESCHFNYLTKHKNYWIPPDGGKLFWDTYVGAVKASHATFVGFHHYAGEFLKLNPELSKQIANLAGYWLFPNSVSYPQKITTNSKLKIKLNVTNKGAAKTYKDYLLVAKLVSTTDTNSTFKFETPAMSNKWLPNTSSENEYNFILDNKIKKGNYKLYLGMETTDDSFKKGSVYWAVKDELLKNGLYYMGEITVK